MVEWKKLGEVCKVHTGSQLNRSDMLENGPHPVVNGGREYSGYTEKYNEQANSITISQGGESAGYVNWINVDFWAGAHCYVVENNSNCDKRYLFHVLKNKEYDIQKTKQGAGIPGLNRNTLYNQIIPFPSLSEQQHIVDILDIFTSSIDNLKQQIEQRRKQYEYYRENLLNLEGKEGVEMKTIGMIAKRNKGIPITAAQMSDLNTPGGNIRVFAAGQTKADIEESLLPLNCAHRKPSVIVKSRGFVDFEYYDKPFTHKNEMWSYSSEDKVLIKYIYFFLSTKVDFFRKKAKANSVKLPQLCVGDTDDYYIPIPGLLEQQNIVSILDTFEDSIRNLEEQLKLREKQYEYYRGKLLTFD